MAESVHCWGLYLQKHFTIQHTQTTGPYFFCNHCSQVLLRIKETAWQRMCFPSQQNFCWLAVHLGRIHELDSLLRGFTGGRLRALFYEVRISLGPPFKMSQVFASRNIVNQEIESIDGNRASMQKYPKEQYFLEPDIKEMCWNWEVSLQNLPGEGLFFGSGASALVGSKNTGLALWMVTQTQTSETMEKQLWDGWAFHTLFIRYFLVGRHDLRGNLIILLSQKKSKQWKNLKKQSHC